MGDIQTDQGESLDLQYVPGAEFQRVLSATGDAVPASSLEAAAASARVSAPSAVR